MPSKIPYLGIISAKKDYTKLTSTERLLVKQHMQLDNSLSTIALLGSPLSSLSVVKYTGTQCPCMATTTTTTTQQQQAELTAEHLKTYTERFGKSSNEAAAKNEESINRLEELEQLLISNAATVGDAETGTEERTRARCGLVLNELLFFCEMLDLHITQCQIFNVDKLFAFEEEALVKIREDKRKEAEAPITAGNPGSCSSSFSSSSKAGGKKAKKGEGRGKKKKSGFDATWRLFNELANAAVKDVQAICVATPDEPMAPPEIPKKLKFMTFDVPEDWPEDIQQTVRDLDVVCNDLPIAKKALMQERGVVRQLLMIGMAADDETWEMQKAHVHQYPDMKRYEYTRTHSLALMVMWRNLEVKMQTFIEDKKHTLDKKLTKAFCLDAEFQDELRLEVWEKKFGNLKAAANSVPEMVQQCDDARKITPSRETVEEMQAIAAFGDWWKVLKGTPSPKSKSSKPT
ncbi:MAG: hypothetical protein M1827_002957 [Pycnora praestabilis]|nr:MAG: hypothetical protein M1827_002957 [Pycnora praestabilis]